MAQKTASSSSSINTSAPHCSICLEVVADNHGRSIAKLQCEHVFHLDCIGSEFNIKGVMQCPNCRVIEHGEWLFAAGGFDRSIDYTDDDDLYPIDMNPLETQWYPFNGSQEAPPPLGEMVFTQTANGLTEEVLVVTGASNPLVNPRNGHQMATRFPMPSSMNDNQLHQRSWIPQAPFPSVCNTITASNQALNSTSTLDIAGIFSWRSSAQAFIQNQNQNQNQNHGSTTPGAWGSSTGTSSSGSPPLIRFRFASQELPSNSPAPAVRRRRA